MITATKDAPGAAIGRIIAATSFSFVVTQLDVTIVNVALPRIATELSVRVAGLQWIVDAYTLPFAVFIISAGVLGDRYGSRRAYLAGLAVFAAASLTCGLAPNGASLIAARAVQGAGAALLIPSSLALLNHAAAADHALRARAVSLWTAAGAVAIAAGPVCGGLLVATLGWRSIFLINVPLCIIGIWLTLRSVPTDHQGDATHHLDPLGQLLAILAVTGLTCAVIEARPLGIGHPVVIGAALLTVVTGIAFYVVEAKSSEPMLPVGLFQLPNFSAATIFGTLMNFAFYGIIFILTLYLQDARGYSALGTGLAYLPLMTTFIFSNLASGLVGSRTGPRVPMIYGAWIMLAGFAMLSRFGPSTSYAAMLLPFVAIPAGMGFAIPSMTTAILSSVDRSRSGTASAVVNASRQVGGAVGVALFGALVGENSVQLVQGLKVAALVSVGLIFVSAIVAWKYIHRIYGTGDMENELPLSIE